jgi:hypothetical protein
MIRVRKHRRDYILRKGEESKSRIKEGVTDQLKRMEKQRGNAEKSRKWSVSPTLAPGREKNQKSEPQGDKKVLVTTDW